MLDASIPESTVKPVHINWQRMFPSKQPGISLKRTGVSLGSDYVHAAVLQLSNFQFFCVIFFG